MLSSTSNLWETRQADRFEDKWSEKIHINNENENFPRILKSSDNSNTTDKKIHGVCFPEADHDYCNNVQARKTYENLQKW